MSDPLAEIHTTCETPGAFTVRIVGEIDLSNFDLVHGQLNEVADSAQQLILDLCAVTYLDSHGLRILQSLADRHARGEFDLTLVAQPSDIVHRLLAITRLDLNVPIVAPGTPGTGNVSLH